MPLRGLPISLPPGSHDETSLSLYVPGQDLESAQRCAKGAVLLCAGDRLWFSTMKEFLVSDGDRGVQLNLCDEETDLGKPDGQLHVRWSCVKTEYRRRRLVKRPWTSWR